MTREQITTAIEEISATLKGPGVSNVERLLLHEDRKELRERLRRIDEPAPVSGDPGRVGKEGGEGA